ncbi:MAG: class I SAM-dependent methyltransferase [Bryobacteraceae bacterium]|nr:class I SAM-dependent methyltransferase [Bryobacteraceae bacterium]
MNTSATANTHGFHFSGTPGAPEASELYLELLKHVLTRADFPDRFRNLSALMGPRKTAVLSVIQRVLRPLGLSLIGLPDDASNPKHGPTQCTYGETMLGLPRLNQLHDAVRTVILENVPGDMIETGVWRGGAAILMRAALRAYGDHSRTVWLADSFQGVPPPDEEKYPADAGSIFWKLDYLSVSLDEVKRNFERFGLLDERVSFLPGWFKDTLPTAPIKQLSILRVDGDSYESTMDALVHLYPKVSRRGFVIIDDYGAVKACKAAVEDFRRAHRIAEPMTMVQDWQESCVYWRRS